MPKPSKILTKFALFTSLTFFTSPLFASSQPELSPEESILVKRITEYWKDRDFSTTRRQIQDFLANYPDTGVRDHLRAMLGDIHFKEKNFPEAIRAYSQIDTSRFKEKTFPNLIHAYFELEDFQTVSELAKTYISKEHDDEVHVSRVRLLLAESLFRRMENSKKREEKLALASEAKPHFIKLASEGYSEMASFALAQIHTELNEEDEAAEIFLALADTLPDQAESLLLQAAKLQSHSEPQRATETLARVASMGGKRASDAAYSQVTLLFQTEKYRTLVDNREQLMQQIEASKIPQLDFYVGRSYAMLGEADAAKPYLMSYITSETQISPRLKTALLTLMNTAQKIDNYETFSDALERFKVSFGEDEECANALFVHANMCVKRGDLVTAENDLQEILINFPEHPNRETLVYDYANILFQNEKWSQSRELFLSYIDQFGETTRTPSAWKHILNCSLKSQSNNIEDTMRSQLIADLQTALTRNDVVTEDERANTYFLLGTTCHEAGRYTDAIEALEKYVSIEEQSAPGELLLALCHHEIGSHLEQFVMHAERALAIDSNLPEKNNIHLRLFNAYLTLSEYDSTQYEKAAAHLYTVYCDDPQLIKKENQSWLANHYLKMEECGRAKRIFAEMLGTSIEPEDLEISNDTLFLEADALKLASLYEADGELQQTLVILKALKQTQDKNPKTSWNLRIQTVYNLATTYEALGYPEKAATTYEYLTLICPDQTNFLRSSAELNMSRIRFKLLSADELDESSAEVCQILNTLKDLQIRKHLKTEPIHFEAALEYLDMRVALADERNRTERALFFLSRIAEDYLSSDDPISREYHPDHCKTPEKLAMYLSYTRYVTSEIKRIEALIARQNMEMDRAEMLDSEAHAGFTALIADNQITDYLRKRSEKSIQWIGSNL